MKFSLAFITNCAIDKPSFMLALYPDEESKKKIISLQDSMNLPSDKRLKPNDLHVTLRYWPKDDFDKPEAIISALKDVKLPETIICNTFDFDIFGKEKDTLVLTIKSKPLDFLQKEIDKTIQNIGVPASDFPTYKAHLTLAKDIHQIPETSFNIKTLAFNSIDFRNNEDKVYWQRKAHMITAQHDNVQDLRNLDTKETHYQYMETGHEAHTKNIMWAFIEGNIQWVDDKQDENSYHHTNWPPEVLERSFYGRVEDKNGYKTLTISVPEQWKYRPVPSGLLQRLQEKFSPDTVKVFA